MGDGNIYEPNWCIEITGHLKQDKSYFQNFLMPLIKKELNYDAKVFPRPNSLKLRIYNKLFVKYIKELGIPTGRSKSLRVLIPDKIYKKWGLARHCIRGVYDTDGSATFDKRSQYLNSYPRGVLHISNLELIEQISKVLHDNGFNPKISYKESSLYLNGTEQAKLFLKRVGFSNNKHLIRLKVFYPTFLSLNCVKASVAQG